MKRFSLAAAMLGLLTLSAAAAGPVKVFILAGQSNMEGHAKIATFDYIGDDPATAPLLKEMRGPDGKPRVCDHVWISNLSSAGNGNGEGTGKVTAGFGARDKPSKLGEEIGPEFTFGLYLDKALQQPVLIIKTAWGGKSLHTDYRPPSAGPYVPTPAELTNHRFDTPEQKQEKIAATGRYYHSMIEHVRTVLKDIKRVVPDYDEHQGYELAGFVWFQGFNDLIATETYLPPPGGNVEETKYEKYSEWLADLIRDVRKDLNAPKMPAVIGVMGIGGPAETHPRIRAFREAMAAPAAWPEFKGNVVAVRTAPFWDDKLGAIDKKYREVGDRRWQTENKVKAGQMTQEAADMEWKEFEAKLISPEEAALWKRGASNGDYHYLGCSKTMARIGRAFAEALIPPAGGNSAVCPKPAEWTGWADGVKTRNAEAAKAAGSVQLVFDGDSITAWFAGYSGPGNSGVEIWKERYEKLGAFDFGIPGDFTQHLLWRLANGQMDGLHPKLVLLMIGTNNLGSNTNEDIADANKEIVQQYRKLCPDAVILLQGILPRGQYASDPVRARIKAINKNIATCADGKHVIFLDMGDKFLQPDGSISSEMMRDYLHPNESGYRIWADAIQPYIARYVTPKD